MPPHIHSTLTLLSPYYHLQPKSHIHPTSTSHPLHTHLTAYSRISLQLCYTRCYKMDKVCQHVYVLPSNPCHVYYTILKNHKIWRITIFCLRILEALLISEMIFYYPYFLF